MAALVTEIKFRCNVANDNNGMSSNVNLGSQLWVSFTFFVWEINDVAL